MKIRKLFPLLIAPLALSSCNANTYELGAFFSKSYLSQKDVADIEKMPGDLLLYRNIFGHEVYSNLSVQEYVAYVSNVYTYLKEKQFKVFGSISKISNLNKYTFKADVNTVADFIYGNNFYFVYGKSDKTKKNDDGETLFENVNCLYFHYNETPQTYTYTKGGEETTFTYYAVMQFKTSVYVLI